MKPIKKDKAKQPWLETVERGEPSPKEIAAGEARQVRGRKMTTKAELMNEMAAALQFPAYFGENWDALNDCLRDFAGSHKSFNLWVLEAHRVLEAATAADRATFWELLHEVHEEEMGFRVVAQVGKAELAGFRKVVSD